MFTYKGYAGDVVIDVEDGILSGRVLDIKDVITFEGTTVNEAQQAFKDSVDDYLEFCQELGREAVGVVRVTLNAKAVQDLQKVADELGIPETEVLRKGLALMKLYATLKQQGERNGFLLREGDEIRELLVEEKATGA